MPISENFISQVPVAHKKIQCTLCRRRAWGKDFKLPRMALSQTTPPTYISTNYPTLCGTTYIHQLARRHRN